jgi:isocitrate dehydrogenase
VLRDYNTDLFPILELGTSAKMLSVVPLMNGGGLFETGAGGSAPKHVQQLTAENYLRWDSLGEFLALAESFRHEATNGNARAGVLGECLDRATERLLNEDKSPGPPRRSDRQPRQPLLAGPLLGPGARRADAGRRARRPVRRRLRAAHANAEAIDAELIAVQGSPADIGGYYRPDAEKASAVMRPSATFNGILAALA